ncbi:hypothetical protein ABHQ57_01800 [Tenacibaculum sp. ZH5_bin.1]|uniref:hypothetical protein n=1 Tax=Tenacibaculum TaxID=104267 RepID=UPI0014316807|nr:hypothetical protein [Tenacibaculum mesophilum]KAF9659163.1 hypothetical protein HBA12_02650 [Tenacibaculum mesophilum]
MKQNKETLKQFFETGDKPTQQQYSDLIDSYVDAKQPEGEANRRFVIDETGEVSVTSEQQVPTYQAGTNIMIDETDPLQPVINSVGESGLPNGYYEEYTFTPQMFLGTGSTGLANEYGSSTKNGRAIRTGNKVYFEISFRDITDPPVTNITGNNGVVVTGLPIPVSLNGISYAAGGSLVTFRPTSIEAGVNIEDVKVLVTSSGLLLVDADGTSRVTDVVFNGGGVAHELSITGTYITNVYTP